LAEGEIFIWKKKNVVGGIVLEEYGGAGYNFDYKKLIN